jgi:hypothetical protein
MVLLAKQVHFEGRSKVFRFEAFCGDDDETLIIRPPPVRPPSARTDTTRSSRRATSCSRDTVTIVSTA